MQEKVDSSRRGAVHYWVSRCERPGAAWLVFLPGLSAGHNLFCRQLSVFTQQYSCFVWDAPAHGASRPYAPDFTLEEMADVLHRLLMREQITAPVVIGQSYGGYIAQMYLEKHPGTLRGFVSVDSCSLQKRYYRSWELWFLHHTEGMYRAIPWKVLVPWSISGVAATPHGRQNYREDILGYSSAEFCRLCGRGFASVAEAIESGRHYSVGCPTLLLCGEKDAAGFTRRYNRIWSRTAGLPLVWVPGAGHNSNADAPDFVNRAISRFLQTLPALPAQKENS